MSIATAFDRAIDYERHAPIQRRVASHLAERIAGRKWLAGLQVFEIGCGTGLLGAALIDRLPHACWLMTDVAPAMVARTAARFAGNAQVRVQQMDGEFPEGEARFDLICSSLAMQWFGDLAAAVARLRTRLTQSGLLAFTTLVEGSFAEWHTAHGDLPAGIHTYPTVQAIEQMGLVVEVERYLVHYTDARQFLHSLKAIGAGTPRDGHRPLAPADLGRVMARFEASGATTTYVVATCFADGHEGRAR